MKQQIKYLFMFSPGSKEKNPERNKCYKLLFNQNLIKFKIEVMILINLYVFITA